MKSNRLFLTTLLLALMPMLSFAQVGRGKLCKTAFGVKAGANLSSIMNGQSNMDVTPDILPSYHAGAVLNLHFGYRNEGSPVGTGLFGLQPEILYSSQGFMDDGDQVQLYYVSVHIMLKYYATRRFNLEAGPYVGYLTHTNPNVTVIDGTQIRMNGMVGSLDAGIGVGIGLETGFGLTLGARYNLGLTNMAENLQWKQRVFSVSLGFLF